MNVRRSGSALAASTIARLVLPVVGDDGGASDGVAQFSPKLSRFLRMARRGSRDPLPPDYRISRRPRQSRVQHHRALGTSLRSTQMQPSGQILPRGEAIDSR